MLIPATSSAAQAASIVAQATAKESAAEATQSGSAAARQSAVEQSNSASADRDAQGQGDGLPGDRPPTIVDELEVESSAAELGTDAAPLPASATLPGEAPSQLDIIG